MIRWWTYQRERFPLLAHGPLIAAFSFCAVSLSHMLRGHFTMPPAAPVIVAFIVCLLCFLQLRIADEFKDFDEDARFRPYRPVPRGLVTLRELAILFVLASLAQLALVLWLEPRLVIVLLMVWLYLAAMTKEFFIREALKARPLLYLVSHMVIMPLIDLFATSTDWLPAAGTPPAGLAWFLAASFFNGMSIDIGRKVRSPADEEQGVPTYSAIWGRRRAVLAWWLVLLCTAFCAVAAAQRIAFAPQVAIILGALLLVCVIAGIRFLRHPAPRRGKLIEHLTGVWTVALYLTLGAAPLLRRPA